MYVAAEDRDANRMGHGYILQSLDELAPLQLVRPGRVVVVEVVEQEGRPDKRVHTPSAEGRRVLAEWLATPMPMETFRSELAVKLRGAAYGDRAALTANLLDARADHATRLAHYEELEREVDQSYDPPVTAGVRLVSIQVDALQHLGQAAYVKGLLGR